MTALNATQKLQRLERRRLAGASPDPRRFRIIVLPAPDGRATTDPTNLTPSALGATPDDLGQATWEDAEWR